MKENFWMRVYHKTLLILAIVIMVCAIIFTVTRLLTPLFNSHRNAFEALTSKIAGVPVTFDKISFGWRGIEPEILLDNVKVYRANSTMQILAINKLYISVSIVDSILAWQFRPSILTVSGVELSIKYLPNGQFTVNDMNLSQGSSNQADRSLKTDKVIVWLLTQHRIYLKAVTVNYYDQQQHLYPLFIQQIGLQNNGKRHNLAGMVDLMSTPTNLQFVVKMHGNPAHWQQSTINAYFNLKNINLTRWLSWHTYEGYQLSGGYGNTEVWLNWRRGQWLSIHSQVALQNLKLHSLLLKESYLIHDFAAALIWQPTTKGWQFSANNMQISTGAYQWPATQLIINYNNPTSLNNVAAYHVWLNFAQLGDIRRFLQGSSLLPTNLKQQLLQSNIKGELKNINYTASGTLFNPANFQVSLNLTNVSIARFNNFPGVTNVSGYLVDSPATGFIQLQASNTSLDFGNLFSVPLAISRLHGKIIWHHQSDGSWRIKGKHLLIANADLGLNGEVALQFNKGQVSPYLSLLAGYNIVSPMVAVKYLPVAIIPKDTVAWLKQAFLAGKPLIGTVIIRGNMADFPFNQNQGVFRVETKVQDTTLKYSNNWPPITHINADLVFVNHSMIVSASNGKILNGTLMPTKVVIPTIAPDQPVTLVIDGGVKDEASDLFQFIKQTPLNATIGQALQSIGLQGLLLVQLHINLPLNKVDQVQTSGQIQFNSNTLSINGWPLQFTNLQGTLGFNNTKFSAKEITAKLLGQQVTASVNTIGSTNTQVKFVSTISTAILAKQYSFLNKIPISGTTGINGVVNFYNQSTGQNNVIINSDLYGIQWAYPAPFTKVQQQVMPSTVKVLFGTNKPLQVLVDVSNFVHAALSFNNQNNQLKFYSGNIRFGQSAAAIQSASGFLIDGNLPSFNWQTWQQYLAKQTGDSNTSSANLKAVVKQYLRLLDVNIGVLSINTYAFKPAEVKFSYGNGAWLVSLITTPIAGTLAIPEDFPAHELTGNFNHIYIPAAANNSTVKLDPRKIPAFNISINDFRYGAKFLGPITLAVTPNPAGIHIDELAFGAPWLSGVLTGSWEQLGSGVTTHLLGNLTSNNVTSLLTYLQVKSSLLAEKGNVQLDLTWPRAPYDFSIKTVSGNIALQLTNGWIINLGESTTKKLDLGRLLNLLSVQHLMLQFNDLSHSGYNFTQLQGHFNLGNGQLTTSDLSLHGPVADIKAKGVINFVKQWLDLKLTIGIDVTASLPVIATIATGFNPVVGVAAWLVDKVAHSEIEQITTYYYKITGPWANPQVTKLNAT
ncbi:MAG: TIGR02099 family protein [Gammaproteobacteria bacterium RIFCSPHIGHO2_12_FULL_35_23]|nr:MAG: TIGR02099 family protein [Gammaproteobacteria bacterium RIFCSPHIGHO2_12_FULL_35_23]